MYSTEDFSVILQKLTKRILWLSFDILLCAFKVKNCETISTLVKMGIENTHKVWHTSITRMHKLVWLANLRGREERLGGWGEYQCPGITHDHQEVLALPMCGWSGSQHEVEARCRAQSKIRLIIPFGDTRAHLHVYYRKLTMYYLVEKYPY